MDTYPFFHQSLLDNTTTTATVVTATTTYDVQELTTSPRKSVHTNTPPNVSNIMSRVILILLFATVAIWANHEASKGFRITIVNEAGKYSSPGKRFSLFYESNDRATRSVLNTSRFVENLLYPNHDFQHTKKQIKSVTLRLANKNFPETVTVHTTKPYEYMITLSPSLMETSYNNDDFVLAVLHGMARVWLYDGQGATPHVLLNGIVEYITTLAGFKNTEFRTSMAEEVRNYGDSEFHTSVLAEVRNSDACWKDVDPRKVAGFLRFHDKRKQPGGGYGEVIRRLNDWMRNGWSDSMMDDVLGMGGQHACASYDILTSHHYPSSSI